MREDRSAKVFVRCTIEHQTARAYLIRDELNNEHWVPKSQSMKAQGGVMVAEWLVDKNDIYTGNAAEAPGEPGHMVDNDPGPNYDDDPGPTERDLYQRGDYDDIPF